jgi:hypothetical protein
MKKYFAALMAAAIAFLVGAQAASAQTTINVYAVKFVYGVQKPISSFTAPQEPVVKPGNYATLVNVEYVAGSLSVSQTLATGYWWILPS